MSEEQPTDIFKTSPKLNEENKQMEIENNNNQMNEENKENEPIPFEPLNDNKMIVEEQNPTEKINPIEEIKETKECKEIDEEKAKEIKRDEETKPKKSTDVISNENQNETNNETNTLHTRNSPVNPRLHRRDRQEQPLHLHR